MPERLTRIETIAVEIKGLVLADIERTAQLRQDHDALATELEIRRRVSDQRAKDVEDRLEKWGRGLKWGTALASVAGVFATILYRLQN